MKTHFYMFRHGETIWNAEWRPHGQHPAPIPLTINGREQVARLADKLADKNINLIISSDLLRAEQTAEIIAEKLNVKIVYDKDLREVNYGKLNGLYSLECEEIFPDYHNCYKDYSLSFPEGESFNDAVRRMDRALKTAAQNYGGQNIAVSTHGNIVDMFLEVTFKQRYKKLFNSDFVHIAYDGNAKNFEAIEVPEKVNFK